VPQIKKKKKKHVTTDSRRVQSSLETALRFTVLFMNVALGQQFQVTGWGFWCPTDVADARDVHAEDRNIAILYLCLCLSLSLSVANRHLLDVMFGPSV